MMNLKEAKEEKSAFYNEKERIRRFHLTANSSLDELEYYLKYGLFKNVSEKYKNPYNIKPKNPIKKSIFKYTLLGLILGFIFMLARGIYLDISLNSLIGFIGVISTSFIFMLTDSEDVYKKLSKDTYGEFNLLFYLLIQLNYKLERKIPNEKYVEVKETLENLISFENMLNNDKFKNKKLMTTIYLKYENTFKVLVDYILSLDVNKNNIDNFSVDEFKTAFRTLDEMLIKDLNMLSDIKETDEYLDKKPILMYLEQDYTTKKKTFEVFEAEGISDKVKKTIIEKV